jgi:CTP-dependent riboflavin kinase
MPDVDFGGANSYAGTFNVKVCNEKDRNNYTNMRGIDCTPINK